MKPVPAIVTIFIIWGSLIMGQLVFVFLLTTAEHAKPGESMTDIFALVAGVNVATTFALRYLLFRPFRNGGVSLDTVAGQALFMAGNIVIFALSESIGVLGFVNGLGVPGTDAWLPFIGGSIILLLIHIPLPSRFQPQRVRL
jgi:hypothetical protein